MMFTMPSAKPEGERQTAREVSAMRLIIAANPTLSEKELVEAFSQSDTQRWIHGEKFFESPRTRSLLMPDVAAVRGHAALDDARKAGA